MKKNGFYLLAMLTTVIAVLVFVESRKAEQHQGGGMVYAKSEVNKNQEFEQKAFGILNKIREEKGLSQLIWSDNIAKVARLHSANMAKLKFFSHRGKDGFNVSDRARSLGLKWKGLGENIGYNRGYENPVEKVCDGWMRSSGHRQNILNRAWKEAALGVAISNDGGVYFTLVFMA